MARAPTPETVCTWSTWRDIPTTNVEAEIAQGSGNGRAQSPESHHTDDNLIEGAWMNVAPLMPPLGRLELRNVAGVARDREEHITLHQGGHARIKEPRNRNVGEIVASDQ